MWNIERVITCGPKYENDQRNLPPLGRYGISNIKYYALSNKSSGSLIQIAPLAENNALLQFSKNGSAENYMVTAAKVLREQLGELYLSRLRQFLLEKRWTLRGEMVTVNIEETEDTKASFTTHACRPLRDHIIFHGGSQHDGSMLTYLHLQYMRNEIMAVPSPGAHGIFIPETMLFEATTEDPMKALREVHAEANNTVLEPAMDTLHQDPKQYEKLRRLFQHHAKLVDHVESYAFAEYDSPAIFEGYIVDIITQERLKLGRAYHRLEEYLDKVRGKYDKNEAAQRFLRETFGVCTTLTETPQTVNLVQKYSRPLSSLALADSVEEAIELSAKAAAKEAPIVGTFVRLQQNACGALAAWFEHLTDFVKSPEARAEGVKEDWIKVKQVACTDPAKLLCIVHCTNDAVFSAYDAFMRKHHGDFDTLKYPQLGRGFVLLLTKDSKTAAKTFVYEPIYLTKMKLVNYTFRTMLLRSWLSGLSKGGDSASKAALKEGHHPLMRRAHTFLRRWGVSGAAAHNQASRLAYLFYSYVVTHPYLRPDTDDHIVILEKIMATLPRVQAVDIDALVSRCDPGDFASSHIAAIRLFSCEAELYAPAAIRKPNEPQPDEATTHMMRALIEANGGEETMWLIAAAAYGRDKHTLSKLLQLLNTSSVMIPGQNFARASQLFLREHAWATGSAAVQALITKSKCFHALFEEWAIGNSAPGALRPVELVFFGAPPGSGKSTAAKLLRDKLSEVHSTGRVVLLEADALLKASNVTQSATGPFRSGTDFLIAELASLLAITDESERVASVVIDRCTIAEFAAFAKKVHDTTFRHRFRCVYLVPSASGVGGVWGNQKEWVMPCGGIREMALSACSVLLRDPSDHILAGDVQAASKAVGNFFFSRLHPDTSLPVAFAEGFDCLGAEVVCGFYQHMHEAPPPPPLIQQLTTYLLGLGITASLLQTAPFYSKNILPKLKEYNVELQKATAPASKKQPNAGKQTDAVEALANILVANPDTDLYFATKCDTAIAKAAQRAFADLRSYFVTEAAKLPHAPPCPEQVFLDSKNEELRRHAKAFLESVRLTPQQVAENMLTAGWSAPLTLTVAKPRSPSLQLLTNVPCVPSYFQYKPLAEPTEIRDAALTHKVPIRSAIHTLHITSSTVGNIAPSTVPDFFGSLELQIAKSISNEAPPFLITHLQKAAYASAALTDEDEHMTLLSGVEDKHSVTPAENGAHISLEMIELEKPLLIDCALCPFIPST